MLLLGELLMVNALGLLSPVNVPLPLSTSIPVKLMPLSAEPL